MKCLFFAVFTLLLSISANCQIEASYTKVSDLKAEQLFGVDNFGTVYFTTEDNTFYKRTKDTLITYTNFQLGKISSANVFNPLKINLFYKDFNTAIILDNRLAEISKIDFNMLQPYKNVSHISTGYDNYLWLFNMDLQLLELYDYKTNKSKFKTVPVQSEVLDLKSDYNNCFLLTKNYLYVYSYFGSLTAKFPNIGYEKLAFGEAGLLLLKDNKLSILQKNSKEIRPIKIDNLLINQFLVTNETLYLYTDGKLRQYQLKIE